MIQKNMFVVVMLCVLVVIGVYIALHHLVLSKLPNRNTEAHANEALTVAAEAVAEFHTSIHESYWVKNLNQNAKKMRSTTIPFLAEISFTLHDRDRDERWANVEFRYSLEYRKTRTTLRIEEPAWYWIVKDKYRRQTYSDGWEHNTVDFQDRINMWLIKMQDKEFYKFKS